MIGFLSATSQTDILHFAFFILPFSLIPSALARGQTHAVNHRPRTRPLRRPYALFVVLSSRPMIEKMNAADSRQQPIRIDQSAQSGTFSQRTPITLTR